ncbi:MAG: ABC transporter ATP-binding protein [Spirochaetales bacterium]
MARNKFDVDEDLNQEFNLHAVRRILAYLKPYRGPVAFAVALMITASFAGLLPPWLIQQALDLAIPHKDVGHLILLSLGILATVAVGAVALFLRIRVMNRIGQSIIHNVREDLFRHLQELPFSYFDSRPHGKILIRVVNYVNSLSDLLSNGLINLIADLFSLAFIIAFMLVLDVRLTLICLTVLPVLFAAILLMQRRQRRAFQDLSRKQSNLNAYLHESLSGIKITQSFARESENETTFRRVGEAWRSSWMKAVGIMFATWPVIEILSVLGVCLVYVSVVDWFRDAISIGVIVAFVGYVWRFWAPIATIGQFYTSLVQSAAYLERIFETIDEPSAIVDAPDSRPVTHVDGEVEFRHVDFRYDSGPAVLSDLSFHVKPGETIALVGATGAGKTTIVNLLSRFYTPTGGTILLDGQPLDALTLASLRRHVGVMSQDNFLFSGTIRDNIRYGKLDATDAEIEAAARAIHAHDFIEKLPEGYNTPVSERGLRLSMGQRQLISFARALLADPALLILDEATSSVDTETERLVQKGLAKLLDGRTSFVIAHRLSTIQNADRIFVIDAGKIIEEGKHAELLSRGGQYARLNGGP